MGLVNLRYYARGRFFWDERARSLEEQVLMPIRSQPSVCKSSKQPLSGADRVEIRDRAALQSRHCRQDFGRILARITQRNQATII